jgi:hypothetical protein
MAQTETPTPKGKARSRPSPFVRIVVLTVLSMAGCVVCAGAITVKNALDTVKTAQAQARELQDKIDQSEVQRKVNDASARPGQPEGPGDFGPLYPRRRGGDGRPCNCMPGDQLCQCF